MPAILILQSQVPTKVVHNNLHIGLIPMFLTKSSGLSIALTPIMPLEAFQPNKRSDGRA
jgi:hypothetical protein